MSLTEEGRAAVGTAVQGFLRLLRMDNKKIGAVALDDDELGADTRLMS